MDKEHPETKKRKGKNDDNDPIGVWGWIKNRWGWLVSREPEKIIAFLTVWIVLLTALTAYFDFRHSQTDERTTHDNLRAYIFPSGFSVTNFEDIDENPRVHWGYLNNGKTPAYKVNIVAKVFLDSGVSLNDLSAIDSIKPKPGYDLFGGDIPDVQTELGRPIQMQEWKDISDNKIRLFIYGNIVYEDKFNHRHFTHFGYSGKPRQKMELTPTHNEADRD